MSQASEIIKYTLTEQFMILMEYIEFGIYTALLLVVGFTIGGLSKRH